MGRCAAPSPKWGRPPSFLFIVLIASTCCIGTWGTSNEEPALSSSSGTSSGHASVGDAPHSGAAGSPAAGASTPDSSGSHGGSHQDHPQETLILLFGAIFIGTVVLHLTTLPALENLPVTVVLFVLGVIFALLVESDVLYPFGMLVRSYQSWVAIDPHLLLFTFLPALLCGDAMTIDTHIAKRTLSQCLILAGPGVVIGSFATAGLIYGILPYGWDFWTCLTVGSILAATDPVAVVGLLKDLGASPVLTMQIQGESLLNDGTAIVLFSVAYDIVAGEDYGPGRVIGFLLTSTVGASALGAAIGIFFFLWIRAASDKLNHHSMIIQISLTLLCAYWSFIFAEGVCHISGVLSTVAAASVLAHLMWPVVVDKRSMHETWHVIETVGNTMVFFLAGVLTGRTMMKTPFVDYLWTVLMYVIMNVLRLVMFLLLRPLLNLVGQRVSIADVLVMTWGGLRGMVGLALAILVRQDLAKGRLHEKDGDRILFLVSGIAALTLIVNATTSPALCKILGITQAPECRKVLVCNVARRAEKRVKCILKDIATDKNKSQDILIGFVRQSVQKMMLHVNHDLPCVVNSKAMPVTPLVHFASDAGSSDGAGRRHSLSSRRSSAVGVAMAGTSSFVAAMIRTINSSRSAINSDAEALWKEFEAKRMELLRTSAPVEAFQYGKQLSSMREMLATQQTDATQLKLVREVFLEALRASYWDQLNHGRFLVGSSEPAILLNSVNLAKDQCGHGLADWETLAREVVVDSDDLWGRDVSSRRCATGTTTGTTSTSSTTAAELGVSRRFSLHWWLRRQYNEWKIRRLFGQQMKAVQLIGAFIEAHRKAQTQIASYFGDSEEVDSPEETWVLIESQIEVFKAAIARSRITKTVQLKVNTMWRVRLVAEEYRDFVIAAHASGVLQGKEAETLLHPLAHSIHELQRDRKQIKLALQQEWCGKKSKSPINASLTRLDAAQRIQRNFRKFKRHKSVRNAVRNRVSVLVPTQVDEMDFMHTESCDDLDAVEIINESNRRRSIPKRSGFLSVLPNSVSN